MTIPYNTKPAQPADTAGSELTYTTLKNQFGIQLYTLHNQMRQQALQGEWMAKYIQLLMIMLILIKPGSGRKILADIKTVNEGLIRAWEHVNLDSERGIKLPKKVVGLLDNLLDTYAKRIDHIPLDDFLQATMKVDVLFKRAASKTIEDINHGKKKNTELANI